MIQSERRDNPALILFAKEPIPGRVKTRLISRLGEQGACDLYQDMLRLQLDRFSQFPNCSFALHLSPDKNSPYANELKCHDGIQIEQQSGNGLGERMFHSLELALKNNQLAILFGADCPFIDESVMQAAIEALDKAPLVFVPAQDGGYMLIGARQVDRKLFEGIEWSTGQVMQQTQRQIKHLGWKHIELPPLADIDLPEDLALLKQTPLVSNAYE